MPLVTTDDGVQLHYEEAGTGTPLIFVHEFAGDHRLFHTACIAQPTEKSGMIPLLVQNIAPNVEEKQRRRPRDCDE